MNKPQCPYKSSNCNNCTHKGSKVNRKAKRVCGFKNPMNCPLYLIWLEEWLQDQEKSQEGALKSKLDILEN